MEGRGMVGIAVLLIAGAAAIFFLLNLTVDGCLDWNPRQGRLQGEQESGPRLMRA